MTACKKTSCRQDIRVQHADFDIGYEMKNITCLHKDIGAVVTFIGLCRDNKSTLTALEIEHYSGMAKAEITHIADAACKRWPLDALTVVHRYGYIRTGEQIVLVMTACAHRQDAFEAASFLMDFLKTDAPFWKKEHRADGHAASWITPHFRDEKNRRRW